MEIVQVVGDLVCTARVPGLAHCGLRVLRKRSGAQEVAVDAVGARAGDWVITVSGSAARHATGNFATHTDLTIAGIVDRFQTTGWEPLISRKS